MLVDWIHFTPWTALAGGILIGLACGALILLTGNIAGISGMLGRLLGAFRPHGGAIGWRATFLAVAGLGAIAFLGGLLFIPWPSRPACWQSPACC